MSVPTPFDPEPGLCATGVPGLDHVLEGGLPRNRLYLLEGDPGAGKTTPALQFLLEGARRGERVLYVSLSETEEEVRAVAASHGWDFQGLDLLELAAAEETLSPDEAYAMYHPAEVEPGDPRGGGVPQSVAGRDRLPVGASAPRPDPPALPPADRSPEAVLRGAPVHGVPPRRPLGRVAVGHPPAERRPRRALVGAALPGVRRDPATAPGGKAPRENVSRRLPRLLDRARRASGVPSARGSGTPPRRPARAGRERDPKPRRAPRRRGSTRHEHPDPGTLRLREVVPGGSVRSRGRAQGERAAIFLFDETLGTMLARSEGIELDLAQPMETGAVEVRQVDPAELSPGQFAQAVVDAVEEGARVVVIDTLNGYLNAMPEERFLTIQLHELLSYLAQKGVLTVLVLTQRGVLGEGLETPVDTTYLTDCTILLRYFEARGEVRRAISVVKKRDGWHERTIRELQFGAGGIEIGEPLRRFHGVLTGIPSLTGESAEGAGG